MKIPKAKKLPSGSWRIRLRLGGEEINVIKNTESACKAEAQYIKAEYLAGRRIAANREALEKTLQEVQEEFLKANRPVLSPATVRSYESYIKHRWPDYKNKRVKDIKWQAMINAELEGKSPKTVKNAWGLVSASLKAAGVPAPDVKLAAVPVNELSFLQPDEILQFCETIKGRPFELAALLMLHGLRLSEVLGLTWRDIDTKHGTITVHGAVVRGPGGKISKQTNKTKSSSRTLPIMIPRLSEIATKAKKAPDAPVVTTHPSNLLDDVKRACRDAGVTETTCHGLRRSYASLLYRIPGVSERQVMQWGGWSNIQTMHKIYIRIAAADEKAATDAVRAFFQNGHGFGTAPEKSP